eukprot:CAMPEP_0177660618 /NCGR_PEP_ID=MMETSP0447-20121125/18149_1 /TAXON_ID=0 /ORGANISM="Stygamoeba regulata, Strain BSH-02190019" /LENGTH=408 /DNA_ID=CAMNT_0019165721 /DNA_START=94 /DNA_END=1320 /DNA_ORIENTATION=-
MSLTPETIEIIRATAPVVAPKALEITRAFYPKMFAANPEVLRYFNSSNQRDARQPRALADAVLAFASHIDHLDVITPAVSRMVQKHCALFVQPADYHIVHRHLMAAIAEVLGDAVTPAVGAAWSEAVMFLAGLLIKEEEALYSQVENAPGGWRGKRAFRVAAVTPETPRAVSLWLEPVDGGEVVQHLPGQYITVAENPTSAAYCAPRHYTVTSPPSSKGYRITPRAHPPAADGHHPAGVMSTFLHSRQVGDVVHLHPPFGAAVFPLDEASANQRPGVFISSGIGVTPVVAMARVAAAHRPCLAIFHADSSPATFALRAELQACLSAAPGVSFMVEKFSSAGERLDAGVIVDGLCAHGLALDCVDIFISTNADQLLVFARGLAALGVPVRNIHFELFGPHLELNCDTAA